MTKEWVLALHWQGQGAPVDLVIAGMYKCELVFCLWYLHPKVQSTYMVQSMASVAVMALMVWLSIPHNMGT